MRRGDYDDLLLLLTNKELFVLALQHNYRSCRKTAPNCWFNNSGAKPVHLFPHKSCFTHYNCFSFSEGNTFYVPFPYIILCIQP